MAGNGGDAAKTINVLVVDDSATIRAVLCRELAADPRINVLGFARDGIDALEKIPALKPDVITLDIEMPRLNGLDALTRIMRECPTPVVMVSSLTQEGADATLNALELGAVDFVAKPVNGGIASVHGVIEELCTKIKHAAGARLRPPSASALLKRTAAAGQPPGPPPARAAIDAAKWQKKLVVIGSSTGGPQALRTVLSSFPADTGVPILIVQHMPPGFTRALAERLNDMGPLRVKEARPGSKVEPGLALMAPGGFHMVLKHNGTVDLNQDPQECGVRPALNVTMESAVKVCGRDVVAAVLTGMGHDGTRGAGLIKQAGGEVVVEAESTCVVYGMPRSIVEAGFADQIVPLPQIAGAVARRCRAGAVREEASA
jgi:two-component system chemotaxis response regulator CheB